MKTNLLTTLIESSEGDRLKTFLIEEADRPSLVCHSLELIFWFFLQRNYRIEFEYISYASVWLGCLFAFHCAMCHCEVTLASNILRR